MSTYLKALKNRFWVGAVSNSSTSYQAGCLVAFVKKDKFDEFYGYMVEHGHMTIEEYYFAKGYHFANHPYDNIHQDTLSTLFRS